MWPAAIAVFELAGCAALIASILQRGPWPFFVVFLVGVSWMGYNNLRSAFELTVTNDQLEWRSFMSHGAVRLADFVAVRSAYLGSVQVLDFGRSGTIRVAVVQGYRPFADALSNLHPELGFGGGRYAQVVERVRLGGQDHDSSPR